MRKKILGTYLEASAAGSGCMGTNYAYGAPTVLYTKQRGRL